MKKSDLVSRDALTLCTIIAGNYLAQARSLSESFLRQHPDGLVFVLLVDSPASSLPLKNEPFQIVEVRQLDIPDFEAMTFRYEVLELCTAVKPFFLEYLFEKYQFEQLFYFDPDIYLYQPLTAARARLADANMVLIPHLLQPGSADGIEREINILQSGVYNLGFIGLRAGAQLRPFLKWWQERLVQYCLHDLANGLFVDQRWMDLAPALFEGVAVLREPGYDVGHWNVHERILEHTGAGWQVNGQPLVFFHFSGYSADQIRLLSRHSPTLLLEAGSPLQRLVEEYRAAVLAHGYEASSRLEYAFGHFENGVPVPLAARRLWRRINGDQFWPHPFQTHGTWTFFEWLNSKVPAGGAPGARLTPFALEYCRPPFQAESIGRPGWPRRLYYFIRNLLRRLGLHQLFRRLLGETRVNSIYYRMVQPRILFPTSYHIPHHLVAKLPVDES